MPEYDNQIRSIKAVMDDLRAGEDRLIQAIAMLAAAGGMNVMPTPHLFGPDARPVILLPHRMFDRMREIILAEPKSGGCISDERRIAAMRSEVPAMPETEDGDA